MFTEQKVQPRRILIVEDHEDIRLMISRLLKKKGFEVINAENGRIALDMLAQEKELPDLILLDLMMPVMDGYEFAQEFKKLELADKIPVVAMSADVHALREQRDRISAQGYVTKPIDIQSLMEVIGKIFGLTV